MPRTRQSRSKRSPVTLDAVRALALALPGVEEGTSYGTPAFRVRKTLLLRMHEDGESLVLKIAPAARDALLQARPEAFHVTDHYVGYPLVLVRLAAVHLDELGALLEDAWRQAAPRRLQAERDRAP